MPSLPKRGRRAVPVSLLLWVVLSIHLSGQAEDPQPPVQADLSALQPLQVVVGSWRGVGQVRRGSPHGAWQEQAEGRWEFGAQASMKWTVTHGKFWKSALFYPGGPESPLHLRVELPDESILDLCGRFTGNRLVLESDPETQPTQYRLTWLILNDNRFTVLFERRMASQSFYQRVGEVSFQREGTRLEAVEANAPECVVTGGRGTIAISYKGQTYYVCCTGCREAFEKDPQGILLTWEQRRKKTQPAPDAER